MDAYAGNPPLGFTPKNPPFLSSVQAASGEERTDGLRLERIEAMRLKVRQSPPVVKDWWLTVESNLQKYHRSDGKERGTP
jgi:hypothetical protein